jgi:hypothetical protein
MFCVKVIVLVYAEKSILLQVPIAATEQVGLDEVNIIISPLLEGTTPRVQLEAEPKFPVVGTSAREERQRKKFLIMKNLNKENIEFDDIYKDN